MPSALPNFFLLRLGFRLYRYTDDRLREAHALEHDGICGVAQGISGLGIGQRYQGDDVAGARFLHGIGFLREHFHHAADLLALAAGRIQNLGALGQHAGVDANKCQRAVDVVDDLESQGRERFIVRCLAFADRMTVGVDGLDGGYVGRGRQVVHDGIQNLLHALVLVRRAAQHGGESGIQSSLAQALAQDVGGGNRAVSEKILHRFVVLLETGIHQLGAKLSDVGQQLTVARHGDVQLVGQIGRDIQNLPLGILVVGIPDKRLHFNQIDHAFEELSSDPSGSCTGNGRAPRRFLIISTQRKKLAPLRSILFT